MTRDSLFAENGQFTQSYGIQTASRLTALLWGVEQAHFQLTNKMMRENTDGNQEKLWVIRIWGLSAVKPPPQDDYQPK